MLTIFRDFSTYNDEIWHAGVDLGSLPMRLISATLCWWRRCFVADQLM